MLTWTRILYRDPCENLLEKPNVQNKLTKETINPTTYTVLVVVIPQTFPNCAIKQPENANRISGTVQDIW